MKEIKFTRRELSWNEYESTFTEEEWYDLIEYYNQSSLKSDKIRYQAIKDLTFEDVCEIINGIQSDIEWAIPYGSNGYYFETVRQIVVDNLRDAAWEQGPVDSIFTDDAEEFITPVDDDEDLDLEILPN